MDGLINFAPPAAGKRKEFSYSPVRLRTKILLKVENSGKDHTQIVNTQMQNDGILDKFKKVLGDIESKGAYKSYEERALHWIKNTNSSTPPNKISIQNKLMHTIRLDTFDQESGLYTKKKEEQWFMKAHELYKNRTLSNVKGSKKQSKDPYNLSQKLIKASPCKLIPKIQNTTLRGVNIMNSTIKNNWKLCQEYASRTPRPIIRSKTLPKEKSLNKESPRVFNKTNEKKIHKKTSKKSLRSISNDLSGWKDEL
ncbi:unnamed protein product [Blepharisma stoltei]|uniref:Uncharacterized protein n=1 Tax=Blepharisma stoltei TaxID=1481888 RepID=A0AAU9J4A6_9CILI|nr:unnamed protein product [Blepharisma stoltei]